MLVNRGGARKRLLAGTALAAVFLLPSLAQAQTWTGGTDYNTAANWNPANVPDTGAEAAIFANTGTASVSVSSAISPQSWTFSSNAQDYAITGSNVGFSSGVTNNASAGQAISIANDMTGTTLSQAAASTLTLTGTNGFTTTSVTAGTLVNNGTLTSTVTNSGTFTNNGTVTGRVNTSVGGVTTIAGFVSNRVALTGGTVYFTGNGSLGRDVFFSGSGTAVLDISNTNSGLTAVNVWTLGTNMVGTINLGSKTLTISGSSTTSFDFRGNIQGSGGIVVENQGLFGVNGTGTYTGATTVLDAYLHLGSQNAIAASSVLNIASALGTVETIDTSIRSLQGVTGGSFLIYGALTITAASTTFSGSIDDGGNGGSVTLLAGHQTFDGANTYSGGTTISGGSLQLGSGGTTGSVTGNVVDNGELIFNRSNSYNFTGDISGTGAVTQAGPGTTILSGANTYQGATNINGGTLLGSAANQFSAVSVTNVNAGGTLDLGGFAQAINTVKLAGGTLAHGALTGTISSAGGTISGISGAATLTTTAGITTVSGTNSFTTTSVTAGTLVNNGSLTSTTVTNAATYVNNGTQTGRLTNNAGTATISGLIDGRVNIRGGTVSLTGAGSISQDVWFSLGGTAPRVFDISGTNSGATILGLYQTSPVSATVNLGSKTLTIAGQSNANFNGNIQGSGGVTIDTNGYLDLTSDNTYTGATILKGNGSLALESTDAIAASSGLFITSASAQVGTSFGANIRTLQGVAGSVFGLGGILTITAASTAFAGTIDDGGFGGGVTLLAGHQTLDGINAYVGATSVNGGRLTVNGSIASSWMTWVGAGATLDGSGIVGNTTVTGGTLAPGTAGTPGTSLTVNGNLAFQSGALYVVALNPSTSSFANVTGSAALGGATVNAMFASGSYVVKRYSILSAAGGLGGSTFGSVVNTNLPSGFKTGLSYDGTHAYLDLALAFVPPPGAGLSGNQQAVANTLINYFNSNGGIPLVFGGLTGSTLTQASGETSTGSQQATFNAMNQFMGVMTDPFIAGRGDQGASSDGANGYADEAALGYAVGNPNNAMAAIYAKARPVAPFEARWSTWLAGYGGSQTTDGNAAVGSGSATSRIYGTAVGADYRFSPFTIAGFSLAGGGTNFNVANNGSGRSDLFQAGAFIRHDAGAAYVTGALAYGWQDVTTDRTVTIAGVDRLRANFNANAWSGRIEGGYRFVAPVVGGIGLTPYVAGQFTTFELPNYAETVVSGANTFALAYAAKSVTASRGELGLRTDKSFAMADGVFTLRGRVAWAHDDNTGRNAAATFQTLPGASFIVNGAAQAKDATLVTASAEKKWLNGWSAAGTFEGEFSNVTTSYAGKGVVRYAW